jgi:hypothetical protein
MTAALPIGVVIRTIEADPVSWLEQRGWLAVGGDLVGQRVQARVERTRWALAGADAQLDLWFAEGRRIDRFLAQRAEPRPVVVEVEERPALRVVGA